MRFKHTLLTLSLLSSMLVAHTAFAADHANDIDKCNQYLAEGNLSKAISQADIVLQQDSKHHEALLCKGRALGALGKFDEAEKTIQSAEQSSTQARDHMITLTLLGNVQRNAGKIDAAIQSYENSMGYAIKEKDKRFEGIDLNLIGDAYTEKKQYDTAMARYLASDKLAANDNEHADVYERIAHAYDVQHLYDQAIEYQIRADIIQKRSGDLDQQANSGLELGRIYTEAGDYGKAEHSINKVLKLSQENGGTYWEGKSYLYFARLKHAMKQTEEAKSMLAHATQIANKIQDEELIQAVAQAQREI